MTTDQNQKVCSPQLLQDPLLQSQVLVSVLLHQRPLPLDRVVLTPHGLAEFNTDFLLRSLQLGPQSFLVLELQGQNTQTNVIHREGGWQDRALIGGVTLSPAAVSSGAAAA